MKIELSQQELQQAKAIGEERHSEALRLGKKDRYGFKGDPLQIHIQGAEGEIAAAKALGLKFENRINTFKSIADISDRIEVRTRTKSNYELIVRPDDPDDRLYVLVRSHARPIYDVVGCIFGENAKKSKWRQTYGNRPPAYFVPDIELTPVERKH